MADITRADVEENLKSYVDPYLGQNLLATGCIKDIAIDGSGASLLLTLGFPANTYHQELSQILQDRLTGMAGIDTCEVQIETDIITHSIQKGLRVLGGIKNTIAIASGKGGVGKSTTTVNLAMALQAEGAKVGILDADIYGPSQPRMLGCRGQPELIGDRSVAPKIAHGIQSMSIGYLIDEETPMIWRGPMVTSALEQLLADTNWSDLDYLLIDLPPGTGDIQLTLCQKIPLSAAIIVTTPQDIALLDARRALQMFNKVAVPVLGIIENMAVYACKQCGHHEHIFGVGGGKRMAQQYDVKLLGSLPLDVFLRESLDRGEPIEVASPESDIAKLYRDIAKRSAAALSLMGKDYSAGFPKIVVENN